MMFPKMTPEWLIVVLVLTSFACSDVESFSKHRRTCCKYSENAICKDTKACIVEQGGKLTSPSLESCRVLGDSKKDITTLASKDKCLSQNFESPVSSDGIAEMFKIKRYLMEADSPQKEFISLEIIFPLTHDWYSVHFRIFDLELCSTDPITDVCAPRCVDVERNISNSSSNIIYDCEGGFYSSPGTTASILSTRDHSYQFDVCFESLRIGKACGSYLLEMGGNIEDVLLVEKKPLTEQKQLKIHMPEALWEKMSSSTETAQLEFFQIDDEGNQVEEKAVMSYSLDPGTFSAYEIRSLSDGKYNVSINTHNSGRISVAKFKLASNINSDSERGVSSGIISFLAVIILFGGVGFLLYRQYKLVQQKNQVCPHRLLESGRIKAKDVFVITNVDNRHHINIVMDLGKYLKAHCAVGSFFFALDPETGITSQENHDPWKWTQSVIDKMSQNGFLLFMAAPPEHAGISIYKDLPNNQTFITSGFLKSMADENRVSVIQFPYSDPQTLPDMIPAHLKKSAFNLPKDMNSFLCQLLDVQKRELCSCLPLPVVHPEILPRTLPEFKGGAELIESIESLTAKVDLLKIEYQKENGGGNGSTLSRVFDDLEIKQLLRPDARKKTAKKPSNPAGLKIDLEANLLSLRDREFEERDKEVHPEVATT